MYPLIQDVYDLILSNKNNAALKVEFFRANRQLIELIAAEYPASYRESEVSKGLLPIFDFTDIRGIEATLYDNQGKIRYGLGIKVWSFNSLIIQKPDWTAVCRLWDRSQMTRELSITSKRAKQSGIDTARVNKDFDYAIQQGYTHVGLLFKKISGQGTYYYKNHSIGIKLVGTKIETMYVWSPDVFFELEGGFVNTLSNGLPFQKTIKGNSIICQTRTMYDESMPEWASQIIVRE